MSVYAFLTDEFSTPDGVVALARKYGFEPPPRDTVRKWFARKTIPSDWVFPLLFIVENERGCPVSFAQYARKQEQDDIFG